MKTNPTKNTAPVPDRSDWRHWFLYLLAAGILGAIYFAETACSPIRGEHWWVLQRYVQPVETWEKIKSIAFFAFPGLQRGTLLGAVPQYIPFVLFKTNFSWYYAPGFLLHLTNGWILSRIVRVLGAGPYRQFWAYAFFIFSPLAYSIFGWTFFLHIHANTFLLLGALYLQVRYDREARLGLLAAQSLLFFVAHFLYEFVIVLLPLLGVYNFFSNRRWAPIVFYGATAASIAGVYGLAFSGAPNQSDAAGILNSLLSVHVDIFLIGLLESFWGLFPLQFGVGRYLYFEPFSLPQIGPFQILSWCIIIGALSWLALQLQRDRTAPNRRTRFLVLLLVVLGVYLFLMSHARVIPLDSTHAATTILNPKNYFSGQMRYYYLPTALAAILFFSVPLPKSVRVQYALAGMAVFSLIGNGLNLLEIQETRAPYCRASAMTLEQTREMIEQNGQEASIEHFVETYIELWRNQQFRLPTDRDYRPFIYNTHNVFK